MAVALTIHSHPPAPLVTDPLDALAESAQRDGRDVVLLHTGGARGVSALASDPLCRLLIDADGRASWSGPAALAVPLAGLPPLHALERVVEHIHFDAPHPLLGWLGFVSYDIAATLERLPRIAPDDLAWPLVQFSLFREYVLFDRATGTMFPYSLSCEDDPSPPSTPPPPAPSPAPPPASPRLVESPDIDRYLAKARRVQEYIAAGDIYQANLAQRWVVETPDDPVAIFRRLCAASPAPYAAFLRFSDAAGTPRHVLSSSPELFLTLDNAHLVTRPIKGTRPRDPADPARDAALRAELDASEKDRAELAMIVDLLRNDLGRVARFGTVRVTEPRRIEPHPTVWHTVATVEADLRDDARLADLLAAVCPGGSITGAPKIRAMQIIEELEGFRRGLYCGNIGAIGPRGRSLALNIAIRTILLQAGHAYVFAGGGVVADSHPQKEYEETLHKARAMMRALRLGW